MTQHASTTEPAIGRDDLKAKLTDIQGETREQVEGVRNQLLAAGVLVTLLVLVVAFVLGRRAGRRSSAVIEVRRA
ncbi:MAG: hypothetical protein KGR17_04125 [Acidobacteria bacterium]|nr:hypothetical protein [Acidobacteriota bacterium]